MSINDIYPKIKFLYKQTSNILIYPWEIFQRLWNGCVISAFLFVRAASLDKNLFVLARSDIVIFFVTVVLFCCRFSSLLRRVTCRLKAVLGLLKSTHVTHRPICDSRRKTETEGSKGDRANPFLPIIELNFHRVLDTHWGWNWGGWKSDD